MSCTSSITPALLVRQGFFHIQMVQGKHQQIISVLFDHLSSKNPLDYLEANVMYDCNGIVRELDLIRIRGGFQMIFDAYEIKSTRNEKTYVKAEDQLRCWYNANKRSGMALNTWIVRPFKDHSLEIVPYLCDSEGLERTLIMGDIK